MPFITEKERYGHRKPWWESIPRHHILSGSGFRLVYGHKSMDVRGIKYAQKRLQQWSVHAITHMHPHGKLGKDVRINGGFWIDLLLLRSYSFILCELQKFDGRNDKGNRNKSSVSVLSKALHHSQKMDAELLSRNATHDSPIPLLWTDGFDLLFNSGAIEYRNVYCCRPR